METINNQMNKNKTVSLLHDPPPLPNYGVGQFSNCFGNDISIKANFPNLGMLFNSGKQLPLSH
jgi:hypothetical protein